MTSATAPVFKPLSIADSSYRLYLTLPSLFASDPSHVSIPLKPAKIHLSCSLSPFQAFRRPTQFANFVSCVAQTSDWTPQGADDTTNATTTTLDLDQDEEQGGFELFEAQGGSSEPEPEPEAEGDVGFLEGGEQEDALVEPPEDAKLFVGNLPYDIDSQRLAMLFEQAGTVEIAEVIYNRQTDQSRGFGFVTMSTVEEAEKAVDMFHQYDMSGRLLTVNKAAPRGTRPERPPRAFEPSFRIYVGNLPWDVDNGRLEQIFSEHGKVVSARVVYDRESGRSRGFGFVTMASETEMNDAIAALDGQSLDGRAIRVNVAEERQRRGSF